MMSDFRGGGGSKMTPKNRTLEGKNWTLEGERGSKIVENRRTSFMYVPLRYLKIKHILVNAYTVSFSCSPMKLTCFS